MFHVYHIKSTMIQKTFSEESSAKRSRTCMNRNARSIEYAYADSVTYQKDIVKMKTVKNLMTGEDIQIPSNTPLCCDPSSETYWSI